MKKIKDWVLKQYYRYFYSPYCNKCGSCGDVGCCGYISCIKANLKRNKCKSFEHHFKHLEFDIELAKVGINIISDLENNIIDKEEAIRTYWLNYDILYDKYLNVKEKKNLFKKRYKIKI